MAITASAIVGNALQKDGRRYIRERHTDHTGEFWFRAYLASVGEDLNAALATYATVLVEALRVAEIQRNVIGILADGRLAIITLVHSTAAQNFAALREAYRNATRVEAVFIGDFLGSLTDAQLQTAFGLSAAQVTTLRTSKLTPATNAATTIRATTGQ
jgi:hypothetical protein